MLGTYFHTLRHLRPVQIYGRAWFRVHRPRPELQPAPPLRWRQGSWQKPADRQPCQYSSNGFRFLNQAHELHVSNDWDNPSWDKLWLYNLHYFDDLNASNAAKRRNWHRALLARWIAENPPGRGTGWEPYPLSLRIVNWIKWALSGNTLEAGWLDSLAVQARFLRRRLEYHLLGNHLFANAKALTFAGLFFQGPEADDWLDTGLNILRRQVPEQILPDGGHFERSPMYHSIVLEDLLDLINLAKAYGVSHITENWTGIAGRMLRWLKTMCHPDGEIALFNDAAFGIACSPGKLEGYAGRLGFEVSSADSRPIHVLPDAGYIRLQQGPTVAFLDVGEIGPNYLPGHAHADTLSFEVSSFGQRFLVNSGTSCYGVSAERLRQRSTAAHNTVVVDGRNSSEVWSGFRVARRARPLALKWQSMSGRMLVQCGHDGYRRLPGRPVHLRQWQLDAHCLSIHDRIIGIFGEAAARFHFHPDVALRGVDRRQGLARLPGGEIIHWKIRQGTTSLRPTTYHPRFGVSELGRCLEIRLDGSESHVVFMWD